MTGFVCVLALDGAPERAASEVRALANAFADLHGCECPVLPGLAGLRSVRSWAAGAGVETVTDNQGWTLRHGTCHGPCEHPVTVADLEHSDGQFSVVSYDARSGATVIATDRFAAAPVYLAVKGGLLYASSSALTLARHLRPPVDRLAVGCFLTAGYQFGTQTHWVGVRRLDPGAYVHVSATRICEGEFWRPVVDRGIERLPLHAAAEHLVALYVDVLRHRLGGQETWIDLTGGYDSRLMALCLDRAGVPFRANTRRSPLGPDIEIAGEIVARTGWPWTPFDYPADWPDVLPGWLDRALVAGDARLEVLQLSRVLFAHRQLARDIPRLLSAGGGEHLQFYSWGSELLRHRTARPNVRRWVDLIAIRHAGPDVLAPGVKEATHRDFTARLQARADRYPDEPASRQLDACFVYKCTGHFSAYRAADQPEIATQLPYYFEPLFSAAFSLPRHHRDGFRLMRTMMEMLDPHVAAVETTRGGPALPMRPTTFHRYLPFYGLLGRKALNKLSALAFGQPVWPLPRNFMWPEAEANRAAMHHLVMNGTLDWDHLGVRELLSDCGVQRLRSGEASSAMVGRVATVEMALARTETSL